MYLLERNEFLRASVCDMSIRSSLLCHIQLSFCDCLSIPFSPPSGVMTENLVGFKTAEGTD